MMARELYRATWVPCPLNDGPWEELLVWSVSEPTPRLLTAVRISGDLFVVGSDPHGNVMETWKVLERK